MNHSKKFPNIQSSIKAHNCAIADMKKDKINSSLFNKEKLILSQPSNTDLIQIRL